MGANYSVTAIVKGDVAPGYESVRDLFKSNIESGKERNAQLCVYVDGERVVDLWGSAEADPKYNADSLQCVFSSSKAVSSIAVAQLVDRGFLNYNNPIANYWPEFGAELKDAITVAQMLKHEGGIPHLHKSVCFEDLMPFNLSNGNVAKILAQQVPIYPVNTPREYHNLTAGWVINEVFRRQSPNNETIGTWLAREVAKPLQADVFLGITDEQDKRVANLTALTKKEAIFQSLLPKFLGSQIDYNIFIFMKILKSFNRRFEDPDPDNRGYVPDFSVELQSDDVVHLMLQTCNSPAWRKSESPHGSVHASARGLATLAAAMANKGQLGTTRILSEDGWNLLHDNSTIEVDGAMGQCRTQFTQGGVNKFVDYEDDILSERVFKSGRDGFVGWLGFGGSVMMWHPSRNIGFGYTVSLLTWWDLVNTNGRKLQKEVVKCVDSQRSKNKQTYRNNNS